MKILLNLIILATFALFMNSCSKCYDCVEIQDVLDANGNVIDQTEVHQDICTADLDEIKEREANGAVCSN